jgi:tRNA(His) 5'-end guanylyltransferase
MAGSDRTALGDRMKGYEHVFRYELPRRLPVAIRIDGRAFHSYLRKAVKPFDLEFVEQMGEVAVALCSEIQGAVFAYHQSDEISVLVQDWSSRDFQPWFGGVLQKIVSISAGIASATLGAIRPGRPVFDARAFVLPNEIEVGNYFLWRQKDAVRNSITMAAHAHFGHSRLQGLDSNAKQELLWSEANVNWDDYPDACKRGQVAVRRTGEREVTFTDRRTGAEQTTTALRTWWQVEPAPHFTLEAGGFLAETIPPMPRLPLETPVAVA